MVAMTNIHQTTYNKVSSLFYLQKKKKTRYSGLADTRQQILDIFQRVFPDFDGSFRMRYVKMFMLVLNCPSNYISVKSHSYV